MDAIDLPDRPRTIGRLLVAALGWLTAGMGMALVVWSLAWAISPPAGEAEAVVQAWVDACNRRDLDRALALFADDALIVGPYAVEPRGIEGRDALARWLRFATAGGSRIEVEGSSVIDERVVLDVTWAGDVWAASYGRGAVRLQAAFLVRGGRIAVLELRMR